jgi:ATP-binding cassette subfamily F protein uup
LPARIEALEAEQRELSRAVTEPDFYRESAATIAGTLERLGQIERDLTESYARWDALDSRPR